MQTYWKKIFATHINKEYIQNIERAIMNHLDNQMKMYKRLEKIHYEIETYEMILSFLKFLLVIREM